MRTNLEKWNYYLSIIEKKTNEFIDSQKEGRKIPDVFYVVDQNGKVTERTIIGIEYSHGKHGGKLYFTGKKPTKVEVEALAAYSNKDIPFSENNLWLEYSEIWGKENNRTLTSFVGFTDFLEKKGLFYSFEDAEKQGEIIRKFVEKEKAFKELHKKDVNYNYAANSYKFLGWQNGWNHVYYDEDGNLCSESGKPRKSFGYTKEDYPEYKNCLDSKHTRIEVRHNQRGTENTVSCPICKIYWKYDSGD
jgi:hypothetical protein